MHAELLKIRKDFLRDRCETTLVTAAGTGESSLEAQREVLDMVVEYLPRRYPDSYSFDSTRSRFTYTSNLSVGFPNPTM